MKSLVVAPARFNCVKKSRDAILDETASMCSVHFKSWEMCTPSSLKVDTRSTVVLFSNSGTGGFLITLPVNISFVDQCWQQRMLAVDQTVYVHQ